MHRSLLATHIHYTASISSYLLYCFLGRFYSHWNFSNLPEFACLFHFPSLFQPDLLFVPDIYIALYFLSYTSLDSNWPLRDMLITKYFCFCHINLKTMLHARYWEFIKTKFQFFKVLGYDSNIISKLYIRKFVSIDRQRIRTFIKWETEIRSFQPEWWRIRTIATWGRIICSF